SSAFRREHRHGARLRCRGCPSRSSAARHTAHALRTRPRRTANHVVHIQRVREVAMNKLIGSVALISLASLWCVDAARAHGGTYAGPGDTVPPGGGGSTGGPGGPATPNGPGGTPGPGHPGPTTGGNPGAPTTPGGGGKGSPTTGVGVDT